jgi:hypothetical protein
MGVRGSICSSVFIVGAGGPGGDSGPCAEQGSEVSNRAARGKSSAIFFMLLQCLRVEFSSETEVSPQTARQSNFMACCTMRAAQKANRTLLFLDSGQHVCCAT